MSPPEGFLAERVRDLPGRDRRARRVDAGDDAGRPALDGGSRPHVAVVGGGLAGSAAAVVLAERGVRVTLLEREAHLGGRLGAWEDRLASGESVTHNRGFHAFFRQYYNVRNLLRRVDPDLDILTPLVDYPLIGPDGSSESFAGLPARAPWNIAALVARSPSMRWRDLRHMDGVEAGEMTGFDPLDTYARLDDRTATDYLAAVGFPPAARRMLFEVFTRSFFTPPEQLSAAEMLAMFHLYFLGSAEGIVFDVLNETFADAVWAPLARHLGALGAAVRCGVGVDAVAPPADPGGRWELDTTDGPLAADAVVLALHVPGLRALVEASPRLGTPDWRASILGLAAAPPFAVWRLWFDRPLAPGRPAFVGTTGHGLLDNISLLHRYEGESRRWALRTGGSVVELHAYALPPEARTEAAVLDDLERRLEQLLPETTDAQRVDTRYLQAADCPAFGPGSHASRPGVATPHASLRLAGDLVRMPFPCALMERAVASGFTAANDLLAGWGVAPEPVWSIPPVGRTARLARWQRAARGS